MRGGGSGESQTLSRCRSSGPLSQWASASAAISSRTAAAARSHSADQWSASGSARDSRALARRVAAPRRRDATRIHSSVGASRNIGRFQSPRTSRHRRGGVPQLQRIAAFWAGQLNSPNIVRFTAGGAAGTARHGCASRRRARGEADGGRRRRALAAPAREACRRGAPWLRSFARLAGSPRSGQQDYPRPSETARAGVLRTAGEPARVPPVPSGGPRGVSLPRRGAVSDSKSSYSHLPAMTLADFSYHPTTRNRSAGSNVPHLCASTDVSSREPRPCTILNRKSCPWLGVCRGQVLGRALRRWACVMAQRAVGRCLSVWEGQAVGNFSSILLDFSGHPA